MSIETLLTIIAFLLLGILVGIRRQLAATAFIADKLDKDDDDD